MGKKEDSFSKIRNVEIISGIYSLYQYVNNFRLDSLPRIFLILLEIQKQLFF